MSEPTLWRCPKHGPLEPHRLASEWGRGEPGEYGTCPVILNEEMDWCGEPMQPHPPALDPDQECESCDDTGIYEEGDEWAPCQECERGKRFAECLRTFAREQRPALDPEDRERLDEIADAMVERYEKALKQYAGLDGELGDAARTALAEGQVER